MKQLEVLNAMTDEKEIQKVYNSIITALHDDAVLISYFKNSRNDYFLTPAK